MIYVIQTLVDAVSVGAVYALSALGIGLLFGVMRLVNFAQGEFVTIGIYTLMLTVGLWFPLAAILTVLVVVLLALLADRLAFKPVRDADPATMLITSFALSYLLQNVLVLIFGARPIGFNIIPELGLPVMIGEIRIPRLNILTICVAVGLLTGIALFLRRTRIGIEMRAAAVDFRMARLLGIKGDRVIAVAFALTGVLSAVVAVLFAAQTGTAAPTYGLQLALVGFVATVIGGMGSLVGAVFGGMIVGVVTVCLQALLPPELRVFREAFVYAVVIAILVLRPDGLFQGVGSRERV